MLSFSQVVILDELSFSDEKEKINPVKTLELEETLVWLADNTAMTLAALSSNSLLDRYTQPKSALSQTGLDEMIARTGFAAAKLNKIMRSSQNIATATSPASYDAARTYKNNGKYKLQETISPGSSSTVPGTRPKAWVYKYHVKADYTKLAGFVTQHLRTVDTERLKCVVLTGKEISARRLCSEMNTQISCYHAGVEMFNLNNIPIYREACDGGEKDLTAWLRAEGGVLVTSEVQFRGAEVDSVIFVTEYWGGYNSSSISRRSPVTRAVADVLMITGDMGLSVQGLRRHWEVEILEEGVKEQ